MSEERLGEGGLMKSRIALVCVALLSFLILACPMPQIGKGLTRDAAGGTDPTAPVASGASISVVNDTARNQAVYINETGQNFDVVAAEYPGGPLVACVQMASFTVVPPSTDPDALPVKALVAGSRNDGSPGVWEIHSDDTIDLPQPEVTDPSGAKCIVGGNEASLPSSVQINLGWGFHVTTVSPDGRMIVGYADNPKGTTVGGVQILPGTTIGVYWRVYSLFGNRFCIVSAPHIIGAFVKQPLPAKWAAHWPGRSALLEQLRQCFAGTLVSYLVSETSVRLDTPQGVTVAAATSTGTYDVLGTNEDGLPALAQIDKTGNVSIQVYVPDLAVSGAAVSTSSTAVTPPAYTSDAWSVSAALANEGTASAVPVTVQYWLSSTATLDATAAKLLDTVTIPSLQPGVTIQVTSPQSYSLDKLGVAAGTYYVAVTVSTDPKLGEIDLSDNEAQTLITVQTKVTVVPVTYDEIFIDTYDPLDPTGANGALYSTYMELWSPDGKTMLSSYDGINDFRAVNPYYAFIDYTGGLISGDYWVLVKESGAGGHSFGYGLRVMGQSSSDYTNWTFAAVATETTSDQPLVGGGGPPATFQSVALSSSATNTASAGNHLNRFIVANGVNWVKIHLP
jgi:CARDB